MRVSSGYGAIDTLRGVYHFLGDRAPKRVDIVPPRPCKENPFRQDGIVVVSKVHVERDLKSSIACDAIILERGVI